MIKKNEYQQQSYRLKTANFGGMIAVGIQFCNHKHWNTNNMSNQYCNCCLYIGYYGDITI